MDSEHQRLLDPAEVVELDKRPMDQVRALRAACVQYETGLSYLRRLIQGSIDIIENELLRRAGGAHDTATEMVEALPGILGDAPRPPGFGRLPESIEPTDIDDELMHRYQDMVNSGRLAHLADADDGQLRGALTELHDLERDVSSKRRAFHDRIDTLQAEMTRRYKSGEASVDALLKRS